MWVERVQPILRRARTTSSRLVGRLEEARIPERSEPAHDQLQSFLVLIVLRQLPMLLHPATCTPSPRSSVILHHPRTPPLTPPLT
ncbi:hypothetical protein E2C01_073307 [Portunus trituberculatus]|uniref:Uncharacterized protein n=1 Tax=Portunus trituberculatus TaxID=210409 RepID=A0A5B7IA82_PORTR|nr:hypothetical protein [Portunus trituberculatus]